MKAIVEVNEPITVIFVFEFRNDDTEIPIVNDLIDALKPVIQKHGADKIRLQYNCDLQPTEHFLTSREREARNETTSAETAASLAA